MANESTRRRIFGNESIAHRLSANAEGRPVISISIVSHGQGALIRPLLADLAGFTAETGLEVILTKNIPERLPFSLEDFSFPTKLVENAAPKGFAANHNAAFHLATEDWFCVLNPDIRLPHNPFPRLVSCLDETGAALAAPRVVGPDGRTQDSARRFPTPLSLAAKVAGVSDGGYAASADGRAFPVDWVAGMFMLFRSEDYRRVAGFDEGFFLYYEDVDICARLWRARRRVLLCPEAEVVHDARRRSHRDLRYMRWHVASLIRYLGKHWLRLPKTDSR